MEKLNRIVSTLCVDKDEYFSSYANVDKDIDRNIVYWKCLLVLFHSINEIFRDVEKVLFTNLKEEEYSSEVLKITKFMANNYAVKIMYLEFSKYDPGKYSKKFRNVFYRFDVYEKLASMDGYSMHLDSDCLVLSNFFPRHFDNNSFLAQQQYGWLKNPQKKHHGFNAAIFTDFIGSCLNLKFSSNLLYFGGEIIGGNKLFFEKLSIQLNIIFTTAFKLFDDNIYYLNADNRIFDNDEYIFSLALNNVGKMSDMKLVDTSNKISKRIWTAKNFNNWFIGDLYNYEIVHLPNEKNKEGILLRIFDELFYYKKAMYSKNRITFIFMLKHFKYNKLKLMRLLKKLYKII
jgi:hypothetical protein